ncbi:MAG: hypothetical protein AAFY65_15430 [Pseudomonadota bacterium]
MIDPDVSDAVNGEIDDIIAGNVEKSGEVWTAPSGRRYGRHNDSLHPIDGPGIQKLSRPQHQLLKEMNNRGIDGAQRMADRLQEIGQLSADDVKAVRDLKRKCP